VARGWFSSDSESLPLGWFQEAEVTCRGVGMGSLPGRLIGSAAHCLVMCAGFDADGRTVSTLEPEHSLRSEGDVAVAVALDGRELR
jgi:hypothetical protein